jgi:hypothetical protein
VKDELGTPVPRHRPSGILVFNVLTIVLVMGALFLVYGKVNEFTLTAQRYTQENQRSTALSCDIQHAIGLPSSTSCEVPEIVQFRDQRIETGTTSSAKASKQTQLLLCQIMIQVYKM